MKQIAIKVFASDLKQFERYIAIAPKGQEFTKDGALLHVSQFIHQLEQAFPGNVFKLVETGKGRFNIFPFNGGHD